MMYVPTTLLRGHVLMATFSWELVYSFDYGLDVWTSQRKYLWTIWASSCPLDQGALPLSWDLLFQIYSVCRLSFLAWFVVVTAAEFGAIKSHDCTACFACVTLGGMAS